ncbi:MAG: ABC transporter ATP-binding protein [Clostridium sp.]|uniref:ABC transporter ATP-binding protein n=1 Tax=Clostridium sp. TaxID=1506 RepID=UPI003F385066
MCKEYGYKNNKESVLKEINLKIEEGEFISIVGTSGSGKTTLLNILGLMDKQTKGEYYLDDKNIEGNTIDELADIRNSEIGFVFQNFNLIDDYTLVENVEVPISYSKNKKKMKKRAIEQLKKLGLEEHINKTPKEISGGQKQRVAIARALVNNPKIILADEPTGALDSKNSEKIMSILSDINKAGRTVIIVTHDMKIAKKCNRVIEICDGKILEEIYV